MTISANIFEGGANDVDLLRTNTTNDAQSSRIRIDFKSNALNGSYVLGTNTQRIMTDKDVPMLYYTHTTQNPTIGLKSDVELYTYTTEATGSPSLADSSGAKNRIVKLMNMCDTVLTLQGTATGSKTVAAYESVFIHNIDGLYYIEH